MFGDAELVRKGGRRALHFDSPEHMHTSAPREACACMAWRHCAGLTPLSAARAQRA